MRQIGNTFVPPVRLRTAFGTPYVRSYSMDGDRQIASDATTGETADVYATLAGDIDDFMRARLAHGR